MKTRETIRFRCIACGRELQIPSDAAERVHRCPHCRALLRIASPGSAPAHKRKAPQQPEGGRRRRARVLLALVALLVASVTVGVLVALPGEATSGHADSLQSGAPPAVQPFDKQPRIVAARQCDTVAAAVQESEPQAETDRVRAVRAENELREARALLQTARAECRRLAKSLARVEAERDAAAQRERVWQQRADDAYARLQELEELTAHLETQQSSGAQREAAWRMWVVQREAAWQKWVAERDKAWQQRLAYCDASWQKAVDAAAQQAYAEGTTAGLAVARDIADVARRREAQLDWQTKWQLDSMALNVSRIEDELSALRPAARQSGHVGVRGLSGTPPLVGTQLWVRETINGGKMVVLSDGSLWEVAGVDRYKTSLWLPADDILVAEWAGGSYPFKLVNTSRGKGEAVQCKYVGRK